MLLQEPETVGMDRPNEQPTDAVER